MEEHGTRRGIFTMIVAGTLVAVLALFLVAFKVRIDQKALVFTFGRVASEKDAITEPGLYFKWPYPMQTVRLFDGRTHVFDTKFQELSMSDGKTLTVTLSVGWSVEDPVQYDQRVKSDVVAQNQISTKVSGKVSDVFSGHQIGDLVSTDAKRLAFDAVEREIMGQVGAEVKTDYGIRIDFVRISELSLPEDPLKKVFDRMTAERATKAAAYREEGNREAEKIRADADRQSADLLSRAEAEATRLRGEGDAAAAEHYRVFRKNPELAVFLRQLESLRKLKDRSTFVLDTNSPPYNLFKKDGVLPNGKKESGVSDQGPGKRGKGNSAPPPVLAP